MCALFIWAFNKKDDDKAKELLAWTRKYMELAVIFEKNIFALEKER